MRIVALCTVLACASSPWGAPLHREHPLVGKIWNGTAFLDEQALDAAVQSAHFVLLGETHDNPDHHALQARLVRVASQGRKPAIVFEMLDVGQQQALDAAPRTSEALAEAVNWSRSGWPDFSLYRPIFDAALAAGLPIVAGNFTKAQMNTIVKEGPRSSPPRLPRFCGGWASLHRRRRRRNGQRCGRSTADSSRTRCWGRWCWRSTRATRSSRHGWRLGMRVAS